MILLLFGLTGCPGKSICPEGMVLVPRATVVLGVDSPTRRWHEAAREITVPDTCMDRYEYPNKKGEAPRVQVSWEQASELCASGEKRLCTSEEWERACRGTARNLYAYGNQRDADRCNTPLEDGPAPPFPLSKAGSHTKCINKEGVADLNGNVSEWVSDPWNGDPEPFQATAKVDPATWRTLRGGTMWRQTFYGQDCSSRHGHQKTDVHSDDGFRCCKTP